MTSAVSDLREAQEGLQAIADTMTSEGVASPLDALENSANKIGRSWSGSWLGYHSLVYYEGLSPPPPGAHFSSEWGLHDTFNIGTSGAWGEHQFDAVRDEVLRLAGSPDLSHVRELSASAKNRFEERHSQFLSILEISLAERTDPFLQRLLEEAKETEPITAAEYIQHVHPAGRMMSHDSLAITQGLWTPPHISVLAEVHELRSPGISSGKLSKLAKKVAAHLERVERDHRRAERIGTNVFIGHGRSHLWKDLKDFVQDRLRLPWDEFNRVPVAGVTNIARLSEMLDAAAIALLVMTAEDEQAGGEMRARMNVVHEAGLFQGRLGFTKAIVLLEESCEEFSNIQGLGQVRFPKGNIKAAFEEVRQVLEREGLIDAKLSQYVSGV